MPLLELVGQDGNWQIQTLLTTQPLLRRTRKTDNAVYLIFSKKAHSSTPQALTLGMRKVSIETNKS